MVFNDCCGAFIKCFKNDIASLRLGNHTWRNNSSLTSLSSWLTEKIFLASSRWPVISSSELVGQGRPLWRHWWWSRGALFRRVLVLASGVRLANQYPCLDSCWDLGCGFLMPRGPVSCSDCSLSLKLVCYLNLYYGVFQKHVQPLQSSWYLPSPRL